MRPRNALPHASGFVALASALLLFAASVPAAALDLASGRLKLTLQEGIGRFSISGQTKVDGGLSIPMLSSQDLRTTMLSVVVGNRIYLMGDSSEFAETVEKTANGGRFIWKSSFLQVTESFTFLASSGSSVTDGVRIDINLKNLSAQDLAVGVRYLFDTYLGESSFVHFRTDALSQVTHELTLSGNDLPAWWVSPLVGDPGNFGLQVMSSGSGITAPDRIVFANWKRLSDSPWSYETSTARNFSLLPYSVNDSAVGQYYDPRPVPHGADTTITIVLGVYAKQGFSVATSATPVSNASPSPGASSTAPSSTASQSAGTAEKGTPAQAATGPSTVRSDLAAADRILEQIDSALSAGGAISEEDLNRLESALKDLAGRVNQYAPEAGK